MSRGAPGVRHMNWQLKARVEHGFEQANGRRMTDYDFSIMTLAEARQYAGLGEEWQSAYAPARPAMPRMSPSNRPQGAVAGVMQNVQATEVPASSRLNFLKRKSIAIPAALLLVLSFGGGTLALSHGDGADASSSRTAQPDVSPASNKIQNEDSDQQPANAASGQSASDNTDASAQSDQSDASANSTYQNGSWGQSSGAPSTKPTAPAANAPSNNNSQSTTPPPAPAPAPNPASNPAPNPPEPATDDEQPQPPKPDPSGEQPPKTPDENAADPSLSPIPV